MKGGIYRSGLGEVSVTHESARQIAAVALVGRALILRPGNVRIRIGARGRRHAGGGRPRKGARTRRPTGRPRGRKRNNFLHFGPLRQLAAVTLAGRGARAQNSKLARPGGTGVTRYSASGGGRNTTSCLAESATTSGGFCSFMPWIAQNRSYSLRVGVTQNRHLIGCSDLLNRPCGMVIGRRIRSPAVATKSCPSITASMRPSNM